MRLSDILSMSEFLLQRRLRIEKIETALAFEREHRALTIEEKRFDAWLRREETKSKVSEAQARADLARVKVERELFRSKQEDQEFEQRENQRHQKFQLEMARLQAKTAGDSVVKSAKHEEQMKRIPSVRREEYAVETVTETRKR
jgi:phage repressor protein C with HTH and peptisase S24 domain